METERKKKKEKKKGGWFNESKEKTLKKDFWFNNIPNSRPLGEIKKPRIGLPIFRVQLANWSTSHVSEIGEIETATVYLLHLQKLLYLFEKWNVRVQAEGGNNFSNKYFFFQQRIFRISLFLGRASSRVNYFRKIAFVRDFGRSNAKLIEPSLSRRSSRRSSKLACETEGWIYYEFIGDAYRARWQRLGAELQIDWIEGVSTARRLRAPRGEINIVFLMLGIIVRVELYRGLCAALLGFSLRGRLVAAALTLVPSMIDQLFSTEEKLT